MPLFIIGDSHINEFDGLHGLELIKIHPDGRGKPGHPYTIYVTIREKGENITCHPAFQKLRDGDPVLFSFGMIDANWLIWKQIHKKGRELQEIIDTLVEGYFSTLSTLTEKKIFPIIYNATPPSNNDYHVPYIGSLEERILYSKTLNRALKKECANRNIAFLDIYDAYSDPQGMLKPELSDGNHHIATQHNSVILQELLAILEKN